VAKFLLCHCNALLAVKRKLQSVGLNKKEQMKFVDNFATALYAQSESEIEKSQDYLTQQGTFK